MTFIHPNRQNFFLDIILFGLIAAVAVCVIWLIVLYNRTVSFTHEATEMREAVKSIETQNSELKGKIFALFDPDTVSVFATAHDLTTDRTPQYSPIVSEWVVASHR